MGEWSLIELSACTQRADGHYTVLVGPVLSETRGSTSGPEDNSTEHTISAVLILALECDRPTALSARYELDGVSEVVIGRGQSRSSSRDGGRLSITVPDDWMSSRHVRIHNSFGRWIVEDQGSKNGSTLAGRPIVRHELSDGDRLELGHTIFGFYVQAPLTPGDPDIDLEGTQPDGMTTLAPGFASELAKFSRLAGSDVPVLLLGESGTGKEVLARAFHGCSQRPGKLVAVNCGAIPDSLVESELFGHKKGAFSGAFSESPGLVQAADGGTLFLDEIADLPSLSQAALLRVLQEREVRPVGAAHTVPVDIRLVSATHRDLPALVLAGTFREDLYARVSGFRIRVPPLRQRREDLGLLIGALMSHIDLSSPVTIELEAARYLFDYSWPRNIRELKTTLRAATVLADGTRVTRDHLPNDLDRVEPSTPTPTLSATDTAHRAELVTLLTQHAGNISAIAREIGKDRKQIHRWLKRYGLDASSYRL